MSEVKTSPAVEPATPVATVEEPNLPSDAGFLDETPVGNVQQQDNSGALYPNLSRKKESHPNCRGRSYIGGVWYWVSGWNNLMPNNTRYVSLSYTELTAQDVAKYITKTPAKAAPQTDALDASSGGSTDDDPIF